MQMYVETLFVAGIVLTLLSLAQSTETCSIFARAKEIEAMIQKHTYKENL
jgi:hypothetical protein